MPTISVIVPVYKVEKYIHRCVDSILSQTFQDFELILVDDGSPDNSGAICDDYAAKDSRVRVIHKENGGLSSARNAGIDAAQGEYLFFLDSDDVIHPDCFHILAECIRTTGAQIALGEFMRFTGEFLSSERFCTWDGNCICKSGLETLNCFFDGRESLHSLVSACCKLWHRSLFQDIRFPVGRLFEDEFTTYKLYYQAGRIAFAGIVLYFYFVNDGGITRNLTIQKRFDEYDAQWERMMFFREKGLDELLGKAAMTFLKTAQWDLIACRKGVEPVDGQKKDQFEQQYAAAFRIAQNRRQLDFLTHYDYFVLAYPKLTNIFRIKRKLMILLRCI